MLGGYVWYGGRVGHFCGFRVGFKEGAFQNPRGYRVGKYPGPDKEDDTRFDMK